MNFYKADFFKKRLIICLSFLLISYLNLANAAQFNESSSEKAQATINNQNHALLIKESSQETKKLSATKITTQNSLEDDTKKSKSKLKSETELSPDKVVLNFENADIQSVIKAISKLSGKNFVIDPRVKGTINIVSDHPISKTDSYKVLEAGLRMQGFAAVEADGVIKVLPETDARTYGMRTLTSEPNSAKGQLGDQIITRVFVIQRGSATQLANTIRPLIAPNNSIAVYTTSNALVVTDYASNVNRIAKIINQLTTNPEATQQTPVIVPIKHAIAADIAQTLQTYLQGGSGPGNSSAYNDGPTAIISVDANTNSLIIFSTIKDKLNDLRTLAMSLDNNVGDSNNNMHVVYLKNADAAHVADVLRVVANNQEDPELTPSSSLAKFATEPSAAFASTGGSGGSSGSTSGTGLSSPSSTKAPTNSKGSRPGFAGNSQNQKDQPKLVIQAEPTTNSLIIVAPEAIYRNLRMIIQMLDIRRAEIMIEAMIVDVNSSQGGNFGIQWLVGAGTNSAGGALVGNYGDGANALTSIGGSIAAAAQGGAAGLTALNSIPKEVYVGLVTGVTTVGGQTVPSLGVLADMLAANNIGNIISRPTLITLDNEEARIMVGSNIGISNGSYSPTIGAGTIVNTLTRMDFGTVLQIKPLITQNGSIQLDVWQEDSQLVSSTINNNNNPEFLKRNLRTSLLVDDGQIIALGGMTHDSVTISKNGIPLLSSIPYLGWLFSWERRVHEKTNLVLFLRPVIIRNAEGYKALSNKRYSYIMEQQNVVQAKGNLVLPTINPVNMENQLPYNLKIPAQPNNLVTDLPIIDARIHAHPGLIHVESGPGIKVQDISLPDIK